MKYFITTVVLLIQIVGFSQDGAKPVEVTVEIQKKIRQDINKEIPKFKESLNRGGYNDVYKEFAVDTFKIERFMSKWMEIDYSDFGMRDAIYEGARMYDSLLNKYYKKLLFVLKGDDKKILIQAQKAWLNFRDSEDKLISAIGKPEYSGGGTMQQLTDASFYLDIIKARTNTLFDHFSRTVHEE